MISNNPLSSHVRLAAIALVVSVATFSGSAQLPAGNPAFRISNFGKVNDHYYRGSQPTSEQLAGLKKFGIRTIIDLRKDFEEQEAEWAKNQGLQYFRIPLTTHKPATSEQIAYFLRLVNDPHNWPIYVHCKGGKHRTGEMTAIYRITQDKWTADQAYDEMKKYRFESGWVGGPQNLKKYVYQYYNESQKASGEAKH